ncbi:HNH endonuclease [Schaalia sp. ZJ405]|uniref:HNH endonuclease family protein n=1 Tax=Schaalia sp. ZJ405 TaxID=2709403 RepID=UPI0013EE24EF|nr:HNH endonuclease family protein [Schaalia sp. ZJ405]QPK81457.1 HNH endonuclease [Schaalia sp. ZJ405]
MARKRKKRVRVGDALIALVILLILLWFFVPQGKAFLTTVAREIGITLPSSQVSIEDLPASQARDQLAAIPVREPQDAVDNPRYSRDRFGDAWADVDRNGCDTRNDILSRDLARPTFKEGPFGCIVLTGTLAEPYTGKTVHFQRGKDTSPLVQIDHVVALANAWESGAWEWTDSQRLEFANDPDNLLAVDGQANQEKLASSADQWLPPNTEFRCDYVSRQIRVKSQWGLSVTAAERETMIRVLADCG